MNDANVILLLNIYSLPGMEMAEIFDARWFASRLGNLTKRGIAQERLDQLVSGVQRQVETSGESEIPAKAIGEMVMEGLRGLDSVAYIRFASVYREFTEARDFEEFASSVRDAAKG